MPRTRRRRLQRQRKKHGIVPRLSALARFAMRIDWTPAPPAIGARIQDELRRGVVTLPPRLSRAEILALAAGAPTRQERAKYRRMLGDAQ